jgi:hypothetical protein
VHVPDGTTIDVNLKQTRHEGQVVGKKVLGLPVSFKDSVENQLLFKPSSINVQNGELTQSKSVDGDSSFSIGLNVDFNQQIIILTYFNYGDLVSYLGGIKSAIMPVFDLIVPIVILAFLMSLTSII